jgi:hypothetical protein
MDALHAAAQPRAPSRHAASSLVRHRTTDSLISRRTKLLTERQRGLTGSVYSPSGRQCGEMSGDPRSHQQSISHVSVQQGSRAYVGTFSNCHFSNNDESQSKSTVPLNLENQQLMRSPCRSARTSGRRVSQRPLPHRSPRRPRERHQRERHESSRHLRVDHTQC